MPTHNALTILLLLSAASGLALAATQQLASSYSSFQSWLPIIMAGAAAAIMLTVVYYLIGVLLNNARIKGSALSEMQQAIGTVFLVVLIIGIMFIVGSGTSLSYKSALGSTVTNQISAICNNVLVNSQVSFLKSNAYSGSQPLPTTSVCSIVNGKSGIDAVTSNLDYGLAASYVVTANLTNQSISELNSIYNFDSMIFFLRALKSYVTICETAACVIPLVPRDAEFTISYNLYNGYIFHRAIMPVMTTQSNLAIYLYTTELILMLILLTAWPYLLAAGILLRTFGFTRRAGGLLIAATIVGVLIFPTVFLFQYASLSNLAPPGSPATPGSLATVGASYVPAIALCGINMNTQTISDFTQNYGAKTTQYQLFCYTSADKLPLSYVYKGTKPGTAPASTQSNCATYGGTPGNTAICACAAGDNGWFSASGSGSGPTTDFAPCYVKKPLSFYVFPDAASVVRLYACYPADYASVAHPAGDGTGSNGIIDIEVRIVNAMNIQNPLKILLALAIPITELTGGTSVSGVTPLSWTPGLPCGIAPVNVYAALIGMINIYGIMAVTSFILPIINILMMLSATFGLSSLMGGETTILGLSRFL